jgi:hypothetical protein
MTTKIIVTNHQGYWGAGETIEEASIKCHGLNHCMSVVFFCFLMTKKSDCWIDGMGNFCWKGTVHYQKVFLDNGRVVLDTDVLKKIKAEEKALRRAKAKELKKTTPTTKTEKKHEKE